MFIVDGLVPRSLAPRLRTSLLVHPFRTKLDYYRVTRLDGRFWAQVSVEGIGRGFGLYHWDSSPDYLKFMAAALTLRSIEWNAFLSGVEPRPLTLGDHGVLSNRSDDASSVKLTTRSWCMLMTNPTGGL